MPTYDYSCTACGHEWEAFHSIKLKPLRKCTECGKLKAKRGIGPGAGIIFKGSGFYLMDYRSDSYKKGEAAAKKAREGGSKKDGGKSDSGSSSSKSD